VRQKFSKLSFVHVTENLPHQMSHFPSGFDAIIDGTYSQLCGGNNIDDYCIYQIESDNIVNHIAWYHEDQLTLLPNQDKEKAEQMIEDYNFNGAD